ncbi:MAG: hypothetical protein HZA51_04140 [Planctomycetes bacterium]|nr:hypothetical protein [Planctomycetota bacterium]
MPAAGDGATIGVIARTNPPEPLLERELASKISRLLEQREYRIAEPDKADFVLVADAAIDDGTPGIEYRPVTAGPEYYRTYAYDRRGRMTVVNSRIGPRTYYVPQSYTDYTKGLGLTLAKRSLLPATTQPLDMDPHSGNSVAWRCIASASGPESDLRWIVNHLLVASFKYLGRDTGREQSIRIPEHAKEIRTLADPAGDETSQQD